MWQNVAKRVIIEEQRQRNQSKVNISRMRPTKIENRCAYDNERKMWLSRWKWSRNHYQFYEEASEITTFLYHRFDKSTYTDGEAVYRGKVKRRRKPNKKYEIESAKAPKMSGSNIEGNNQQAPAAPPTPRKNCISDRSGLEKTLLIKRICRNF